MQDLLLEFGVITRRAEYANGEIKLVIGNRRDANLFARRVGFWGAKQEKLEQILDALPGSTVDATTSTASRSSPSTCGPRAVPVAPTRSGCEKHSFDRTADWERRGHEILGHIPSAEVQSGHRPAGLERLVLRHRRVGRPTPACSRCSRSGSIPTITPSSPPGSSTTTPNARLAPLAMQLLGEIDEDTVDFTPTYDGNTVEPVVLPGEISQPPGQRRRRDRRRYGDEHPAAQPRGGDRRGAAPLDHPDATVNDLMQFVKGPDFPTGAMILGRSGIHDAYTTGRGSIKMRAVAEIEEDRKGEHAHRGHARCRTRPRSR